MAATLTGGVKVKFKEATGEISFEHFSGPAVAIRTGRGWKRVYKRTGSDYLSRSLFG